MSTIDEGDSILSCRGSQRNVMDTKVGRVSKDDPPAVVRTGELDIIDKNCTVLKAHRL